MEIKKVMPSMLYHKFSHGLLNTAKICLAIALVFLINLLGFRHFAIIDLTNNQLYTLSNATKEQISGLDKESVIYVFYPQSARIYKYIKSTVEQLVKNSPYLSAEYIDGDKNILRAQELKQQFSVRNEESLVVSCNEKFEVIAKKDLVDIEYSKTSRGLEQRITAYKGEHALVFAIMAVTGHNTHIPVPSKLLPRNKLNVSNAELSRIRVVVLFLMPFAALFLGIIVRRIRKKS